MGLKQVLQGVSVLSSVPLSSQLIGKLELHLHRLHITSKTTQSVPWFIIRNTFLLNFSKLLLVPFFFKFECLNAFKTQSASPALKNSLYFKPPGRNTQYEIPICM